MNDKPKRGVQITRSSSSIILLALVLLFPWLIALYPTWRSSRAIRLGFLPPQGDMSVTGTAWHASDAHWSPDPKALGPRP